MVAADAITEDTYALASHNRIWKNWGTSALTNTICGGSNTVTAVQIAAKNDVVFALGQEGHVYFLGGVSPTCWTHIAKPSSIELDQFTTIATDNDFFLGPGLWGVDSSGNMWAAQ